MITNECSSVQPLVLPAPLVSSSAFAGAVAAADGIGSVPVRASAGAVLATAADVGAREALSGAGTAAAAPAPAAGGSTKARGDTAAAAAVAAAAAGA